MAPCCSRPAADGVQPEDADEPARDDAVQLCYPLYVLPLRTFLALEAWVPHQKLLERGLLVEVKPSDSTEFVFVSHQWRGSIHPDLDCQQLRTLQSVLRKLLAGDCTVKASLVNDLACFFLSKGFFANQCEEVSRLWRAGRREPCLWIDYLCVPQPTVAGDPVERRHAAECMSRAVQSIVAYVQMATCFIVLAPPLERTEPPVELMNFGSWQQRGWCLMERTSWHLSRQRYSQHLLVVEGDGNLVMQNSGIFHAVTLGTANWSDPSDVDRLEPILYRLLDCKRRQLREDGDKDELRSLLQLEGHYLQRLPSSFQRVLSRVHILATKRARPSHMQMYAVEAFLAECAMEKVTSRDRLGRTPLHLAAAKGDTKVIASLLACRADPRALTTRVHLESATPGGLQVLDFAAAWCCQPKETAKDVVDLLLQARCTLTPRTSMGITPLHQAAVWNNATMARLLLERQADVNRVDGVGLTPILLASLYSASGVAKVLTEWGAHVSANDSGPIGLAPLHTMAVGSSSAGAVLQVLLDAGADPNGFSGRLHLRRGNWTHNITMASVRLLWRCGMRDRMGRWGFLVNMSTTMTVTPLMMAAMAGNLQTTQALLASRADPELRTRSGLNAYDLAVAADRQCGGGNEALLELLRKGLQVKPSQTGRRTADEV